MNGSAWETRVALIEDGVVQALHIERAQDGGGLVGNTYLGKVTRVLAGLQSAFLDIGLDKAAFLHVADLPAEVAPDGAAAPIEQRVFVGQTLLVQVQKDAIGSKGARVSMRLSLAGRLLVLLAQEHEFGVSQRLPAAERAALRARLVELLDSGDGCGFILRTQGEHAADAELIADAAELRAVWARIQDAARRQAPKTLVHRDATLLQRVLRDLVSDTTSAIWFDARPQFDEMAAFAEHALPGAGAKLRLYDEAQPIFERHGIEAELYAALGRRVALPSGGHLVIDQAEALTVIDVNTGTFVGQRHLDATVLRTNLEAAREIARQLRLRNLGGIVIVDFIDMRSVAHQQAVLAELRTQLGRDHVKTAVGAFSALGLVELTRKRTRESLMQQLCEPCPACRATGHVLSARTVGHQILRVLARQPPAPDVSGMRVIAAAPVLDWLQAEGSVYLSALENLIGMPLTLVADSSAPPDRYDVVLL